MLRPVESPTGELMRGHGVADRIMLVYERAIKDWKAGEKIDLQPVGQAARIARSFVSGCHEQCEERYLFPVFRAEGYLADLVDTLLQQHIIGREVTDRIIDLSTPGRIRDDTHMNVLMTLCRSYIFMYRPHMSREDTELFPRLYEIVPADMVSETGEMVRSTERQSLGEKGFDGLLHDLSEIEQSMGIGDVAGYTIGYG
ncbi:MAG: hemerythrin domain-containing protein [Methanocella sp.]